MFSPMRKKAMAVEMLMWLLVIMAILVVVIILAKNWNDQILLVAGG